MIGELLPSECVTSKSMSIREERDLVHLLALTSGLQSDITERGAGRMWPHAIVNLNTDFKKDKSNSRRE